MDKKEKIKLLSPKLDVVFQALFGEVGSERITKKFLEAIIVNFEIKRLKSLKYHSKWKIIEEDERQIILTEHLELHIIEARKKFRAYNWE